VFDFVCFFWSYFLKTNQLLAFLRLEATSFVSEKQNSWHRAEIIGKLRVKRMLYFLLFFIFFIVLSFLISIFELFAR
jgi:hypothetical protein